MRVSEVTSVRAVSSARDRARAPKWTLWLKVETPGATVADGISLQAPAWLLLGNLTAILSFLFIGLMEG